MELQDLQKQLKNQTKTTKNPKTPKNQKWYLDVQNKFSLNLEVGETVWFLCLTSELTIHRLVQWLSFIWIQVADELFPLWERSR